MFQSPFFRAEVLTEYTDQLAERLDGETDPPSFLLVAVMFLFAKARQVAVHASGKFVGALIKELATGSPSLAPSLVSGLQETQRLVVDCLKKKGNGDDLRSELDAKVEFLRGHIKENC